MPPPGPADAPNNKPELTADRVTVAALPRDGTAIRLEPGPKTLQRLAAELQLLGLRKLRLEGRLEPEGGGRDWRLTGHLGATVVQPCTVTLEPVTTRLEEPVTRRFVEGWEAPEPGTETEMPEDDSTEPLSREIDLAAVLTEALALALPLYPRADAASFAPVAVAEPGQTPMTDEDAKPFAGLAALRAQLTEARDDKEDDQGSTPPEDRQS